ncbi:helix-turn-helix transcriptional regulator [Peptoniphilus equinus]|uniref:Helix-turn-helix transcriptional regulator n=1 Tax=Peptoniphilus equinus TaxID=3016343 RepID=A0ABY7QTM3_9FIRM|nr:helix-turn-helix transcriptional regulator [Peptoniphilus equinus]WBW50082.1 helix-turn-helix transcriptional regulator [Peptoniphilus equinus]
MLHENIKALRTSKGLSQDELAVKLNVVRQTVSKWERGLSVPDSEMLLVLSQVFDTPVSALLGETVAETTPDDVKVIAEKLEVINTQLARHTAAKAKWWRRLFIAAWAVLALTLLTLYLMGSPYLSWDYSNPETAVMGTLFHAFEWLAARIVPLILAGLAAAIAIKRLKGKHL